MSNKLQAIIKDLIYKEQYKKDKEIKKIRKLLANSRFEERFPEDRTFIEKVEGKDKVTYENMSNILKSIGV